MNREAELENGCLRVFKREEQGGAIYQRCEIGNLCPECEAELKGIQETEARILGLIGGILFLIIELFLITRNRRDVAEG